MEWVEPIFHRRDVDAAGQILRLGSEESVEVAHAFAVLDNWRAAHAFPLNSFQTVLRGRAREVSGNAFVAQRLKRVPSILKKLADRRTMRLSQMQDIGGCRAVVPEFRDVRTLLDIYSRGTSSAVSLGQKDYIARPRPSGYRSVHLTYRYKSTRTLKRSVFDGLQVEVQIRSQLQHAWATAVETVGTLLGHALKSSEGPEQWLALFRYISSLFAYVEGTSPVPGTPYRPAVAAEVRREAYKLRMHQRLRAFRHALRVLENAKSVNAQYFLLQLNPALESLEISGYREGQLEQATERYLKIERDAAATGVDVVLVRAESIDALKRAYPNYFLDTEYFLRMVDEVTGRAPRRPANSTLPLDARQ